MVVAICASLAWLNWKSASVWLNILRVVARCSASSMARRAKPSAAAATEVRNTSSVRIATLKPSPGAPMRCVSGTRQFWKRRRASGCGAITWIRSAISKPGVPASTMKAEMPRGPGASPVRQNTT
jgi:hypothetical protein